jgi:hypothetical protein
MRSEIIATIDELNQYLQGNVTDEALVQAVKELVHKLEELLHKLDTTTNR